MITEINSFSAAWWSWIAPLSIQVAVLAGIVWCADLILRKRGWPQDYGYWCL
jgi:hypothetical protein